MARSENVHPASGSPGLFYGWKMVGVAFIVDFIAVGFFFYSYGVFLKEIAAEVAGARFGASMGISVANGIGALAAPFVGRALDRFPIKYVMILGALLVSAGFFALSRMTTLWQFYLAMGTLLALGMSMMGGLSSAKLVANWFARRRGAALGIATVGVSLSGLVMPVVATWLIATVGWRSGFQAYSVLTIVVVVPLVAAFVVDRPEQMGQLADGGFSRPGPFVPDVSQEHRWGTREILRNRNFWTIAFPFSLAFSALSAILIHLIPFASDIGITGYRAAWIPSVAAGAGVLGKILFGRMVDRMDSRYAIWASLTGQLIGVLLFLHGGDLPWLLCAAAIFGFSMGGVVPLHGAVTAEYFGRLSFGKAMGLLRPMQMPIHLLGVPLAGWIFDTTGSYDTAFLIFAGFYVAAIAFTAALRPAESGRSDDQLRPA